MTDDEFKKSIANLKQTVPLMMKYHVAATPSNYALWYTYVDKTVPQLNEELEGILKHASVCSPGTNTHLYKRHVASREETRLDDFRASIEQLVNEVSSSVNDTLSDTNQFNEVIDKRFSELERAEKDELAIDEVMTVVRQLVSDSNEIRHATRFLNHQLSSASEEINRLKDQLANVQKDVMFDSVTELFNRRAFNNELFSYCRAEQPICLILLDIDHFKAFNDTYGHLFGDRVLRGIAHRLQMSCVEGVTAYRYGGEEFALILTNKGIRIARQFAETLRRSIEKLSVKDRRTEQLVGNITASFGVAELIAGESPEELVDRADKMLYEAKQSGRNQVMPA
ncbi:GGDEF domain-containing protein [Vibrio sp.]|uniref:GGDEF domain-containing protein n=1 Tax=Vibrio sp. TaxID=678 RepID=UPI003D09736C